MPQLYDDKFFSDRTKPTWRADYEWFGRVLRFILRPRSAVDFGCGNGLLMAPLARRGVSVTGYDLGDEAAFHAEQIVRDRIFTADITKPLSDIPLSDLSICVEVAEHVEERHAEPLMDNITSCSKWLIFSAAVPGQAGVGHVNLKPWPYWRQNLAQRGFVVSHTMTLILRWLLRTRIRTCTWLPRNTRILQRKRRLSLTTLCWFF